MACVIAGKDEKSIFIHAHAPNRETLPLSVDIFSTVVLISDIINQRNKLYLQTEHIIC